MSAQAEWREARLTEGLCGVCGKWPRALDLRPHMAAQGRLIKTCRECATRKVQSPAYRRSQDVRAAKRLVG